MVMFFCFVSFTTNIHSLARRA